MSSFAGLQQGHIWGKTRQGVDMSSAPCTGSIPPPTITDWIRSFVSLQYLIFSPNLVWLVIAAALYVAFPYDLNPDTSSARHGPLTREFLSERLPLWLTVVMLYFSFWHVSIRMLCTRSFIPKRRMPITKVLHNVWYTMLGACLFVCFENAMVFLWVRQAVPYVTDAELRHSLPALLAFVVGVLLIPLWRDGHFYFAHRFLHFHPLYRFVHSVHHRNTDVEPFSGLCMHPVEHLYYYASLFPSVVFRCHPFLFLFNAVHFLLAPAASHSGYEDHWQADLFHYYHHRYFECNYAGLGCAFLDLRFGSFCGKATEKLPLTSRPDAKATVTSIISLSESDKQLFNLGVGAIFLFWVHHATHQNNSGASPLLVGLVCSLGPVCLAVIGTVLRDSSTASLTKPFQMRPAWETLLHVVVGSVFSAYPVFFLCASSIHAKTRSTFGE